jgi:hypothetical protein
MCQNKVDLFYTNFFSFKNVNRERKQREVYLESMKKEAEQKKQQAERIDRRAVLILIFDYFKTNRLNNYYRRQCVLLRHLKKQVKK